MIELLTDPTAWVSFLVLTLMECVLGIDNVVFISILASRLPAAEQDNARRIGLSIAVISRIALLLGISWVMKLKATLFTLYWDWTGKDLILLGGGLFLLYKAVTELYELAEKPGEHHQIDKPKGKVTLRGILVQVLFLDVVFSLDSVITAVGMVDTIAIMVAAVITSATIMVVFSAPIGRFISHHPSVKVLALAFLVLIGVMLLIESTQDVHLSAELVAWCQAQASTLPAEIEHVCHPGGHSGLKGYIYAAMGFALLVEIINLRRKARETAQPAG